MSKCYRNAIAPRAVYASANAEYRYRHPMCSVIDAFINDVEPPLCKPGVGNVCYYQSKLKCTFLKTK